MSKVSQNWTAELIKANGKPARDNYRKAMLESQRRWEAAMLERQAELSKRDRAARKASKDAQPG